MAIIKSSTSLYLDLKEVLGLPDRVVSMSIDLKSNDIATVTVTTAMTTDQADAVTEVMKRYRIEKITDEPQP